MAAEIMRQSVSAASFIVSGRVTTANTIAVVTTASVTIGTVPHSAHKQVPWVRAQGAFDPLIPGTNIPIYRIAALLSGGMPVKEVAEDFPSLNEQQIMRAQEYALANPPSPAIRYPKQSMKRLLRRSGFTNLTDAD